MFLVKRFVGLRVLYIYSFAFDLVELGECTRIRGKESRDETARATNFYHQRNEICNSNERHARWAFPHTTLDSLVGVATHTNTKVSHKIWWNQLNTWATANSSENA